VDCYDGEKRTLIRSRHSKRSASRSTRSQTPAEGIEAVNHPRQLSSGRRHSFSGFSVADYALLYQFSALVEGGIPAVELEKKSELGNVMLEERARSLFLPPSEKSIFPPPLPRSIDLAVYHDVLALYSSPYHSRLSTAEGQKGGKDVLKQIESGSS
jgi:hypothetical protein